MYVCLCVVVFVLLDDALFFVCVIYVSLGWRYVSMVCYAVFVFVWVRLLVFVRVLLVIVCGCVLLFFYVIICVRIPKSSWFLMRVICACCAGPLCCFNCLLVLRLHACFILLVISMCCVCDSLVFCIVVVIVCVFHTFCVGCGFVCAYCT